MSWEPPEGLHLHSKVVDLFRRFEVAKAERDRRAKEAKDAHNRLLQDLFEENKDALHDIILEHLQARINDGYYSNLLAPLYTFLKGLELLDPPDAQIIPSSVNAYVPLLRLAAEELGLELQNSLGMWFVEIPDSIKIRQFKGVKLT